MTTFTGLDPLVQVAVITAISGIFGKVLADFLAPIFKGFQDKQIEKDKKTQELNSDLIDEGANIRKELREDISRLQRGLDVQRRETNKLREYISTLVSEVSITFYRSITFIETGSVEKGLEELNKGIKRLEGIRIPEEKARDNTNSTKDSA